ncbi:MAG: hypothetical protein KAJ40_07745 [Alphaproteobacteria bacterium]|nr:hypothetical protein [Alphaproteobacteria bacterium]
MRIFTFLFLFTLAVTGVSGQSMADKATYWGFLYHDGYKHDFQPYLGQEKLAQPSTADMDSWTPADWVDNPGDEKVILHDFYSLGLIKKQYIDRDNIPALRVGEPFIQLSSFDQKRVLAFIDYVFKITESEENGMFYVYYNRNDSEPLGIYNKSGFISY